MRTQTIKTDLLINGKKVIEGCDFFDQVIKFIPDIKENQEVFNDLVLSDNPDIRRSMTCRKYISKKSVYILLNDTNQEIVEGVLKNSELAKQITQEVLLNIIETDNTKLLKIIASHVDIYVKCDSCKLVKILANHKSASVRYSLVNRRDRRFKPANWDVLSVKILKQLVKDKDINVARRAADILEERI